VSGGSLAAEGVIPNRYDRRGRGFVITTWDPEGKSQAGVGLKKSTLCPKEPAYVCNSGGLRKKTKAGMEEY